MTSMLFLLLAGAAVPSAVADKAPVDAQMRKPRDPDIAVEEELCAARKAGTVAAYDLFLDRHPRHPLADTARKERSVLATKAKRPNP